MVSELLLLGSHCAKPDRGPDPGPDQARQGDGAVPVHGGWSGGAHRACLPSHGRTHGHLPPSWAETKTSLKGDGGHRTQL